MISENVVEMVLESNNDQDGRSKGQGFRINRLKRPRIIGLTVISVVLILCAAYVMVLNVPQSASGIDVDTIVCLGDSVTQGVGASSGHDYPEVLKALSAQVVYNEGVGDDTITGMIARYDEDVAVHAPTWVVIFGGINDIDNGRTASQIKTDLTTLWGMAIEGGAMVITSTIIPKNLWTPEQHAIRDEVNSWILTQPCDQIVVIDFNRMLEDVANPDNLLQCYASDHVHLNDIGYAVMASTVFLAYQSYEVQPRSF